VRLDPAEHSPARGQQYPVVVVLWFLTLVISVGVSLHGAANVLAWLSTLLGWRETSPNWTTGRLWLLRLGLAALNRPLTQAEDWVWLVDHSVQIGQCKTLVILGIRSSQWPGGRPLVHEDMELIALEPMTVSTKETVNQCLEAAVARTGIPRAIVNDCGADIHGAVRIFSARHPETIELYDIKHKAACLLKAHLQRDERWTRFISLAGTTKPAVLQTELACLAPPSQRSKARFMNVEELTEWGRKTLFLQDNPSLLEKQGLSPERVRAKFGWLEEFREALADWSAYHTEIGATLEFVRTRGLFRGAGEDLAAELPVVSEPAASLRHELVSFVTAESAKLLPGEVLPATTEVLESCFGKLKALEGSQSKSGFTGLILSLGAMVSNWTSETIREELERCRVADVMEWCRQKLGVSVQSQRQQVYSSGLPQAPAALLAIAHDKGPAVTLIGQPDQAVHLVPGATNPG
jgi:hypothetical protein